MLLLLNTLKQIKAGLSIVNSNFSASSFLFTFTINKKFSSSSNCDNGEEDNKNVEKTISSQELHNNKNIINLNDNASVGVCADNNNEVNFSEFEISNKVLNAIIDKTKFNNFDILNDIKTRPSSDFETLEIDLINSITGKSFKIKADFNDGEVFSILKKTIKSSCYYIKINKRFFEKFQKMCDNNNYFFVLKEYNSYNFNRIDYKLQSIIPNKYYSSSNENLLLRPYFSKVLVLYDDFCTDVNKITLNNLFIVTILPKYYSLSDEIKFTQKSQEDVLVPNVWYNISLEYVYCSFMKRVLLFSVCEKGYIEKLSKIFLEKNIPIKFVDYTLENVTNAFSEFKNVMNVFIIFEKGKKIEECKKKLLVILKKNISQTSSVTCNSINNDINTNNNSIYHEKDNFNYKIDKFKTIDFINSDLAVKKYRYDLLMDQTEFNNFDILNDIKTRSPSDFEDSPFGLKNAYSGKTALIRVNPHDGELFLGMKNEIRVKTRNYYFKSNKAAFDVFQKLCYINDWYVVLRPYTYCNFNQVNKKIAFYLEKKYYATDLCKPSIILVLYDNNDLEANNNNNISLENIFIVALRPNNYLNKNLFKVNFSGYINKGTIADTQLFDYISDEYLYCNLKKKIEKFFLVENWQLEEMLKIAKKNDIPIDVVDYVLDNMIGYISDHLGIQLAIPVIIFEKGKRVDECKKKLIVQYQENTNSKSLFF